MPSRAQLRCRYVGHAGEGCPRLSLPWSAQKKCVAAGVPPRAQINGVTAECYQCRKPTLFASLAVGDATEFTRVDVRHPYDIDVLSASGDLLASMTLNLDEHGAYTVVLHNSNAFTWDVVTDVVYVFHWSCRCAGGW